ncbi:MAG: hypothetical protein WBO57_07310 [Gammaproteobacteria bacterium]
MRTGIISIISILCTHTLLVACSINPAADSDFSPATGTMIPALDPTQVHFIAWVPRDQAQTAAVARALTHIAVGNAREKTGNELCDGTWLLNGTVTGRVEPTPVRSPATSGGYAAWYYRISHQPGFHGCASQTPAQLYLHMQANLPAWVIITPAAQETGTAEDIKGTLTLLE